MSYYLLRVCDRCHDAMLMHRNAPQGTFRDGNGGDYVLCDKCAKAYTELANAIKEDEQKKRIEFLKGVRV